MLVTISVYVNVSITPFSDSDLVFLAESPNFAWLVIAGWFIVEKSQCSMDDLRYPHLRKPSFSDRDLDVLAQSPNFEYQQVLIWMQQFCVCYRQSQNNISQCMAMSIMKQSQQPAQPPFLLLPSDSHHTMHQAPNLEELWHQWKGCRMWDTGAQRQTSYEILISSETFHL